MNLISFWFFFMSRGEIFVRSNHYQVAR